MVEGNGLENRRAGNGTVGSNPTLSASNENDPMRVIFIAVSKVRTQSFAERKLSQKLVLRKLKRKRTKSAIPLQFKCTRYERVFKLVFERIIFYHYGR